MSDYELGDRQVSRMTLARQAADSEQKEATFRAATQADAVDQVACRVGDASCATAHASTLSRSARIEASTEKSLLRLQRQYGNRYVGQVLSRGRAGEEGGGLDSVERSIDRARGGGQGLDHGVRRQMESSFGADFGGVRVHTDANADSLNRALSARAFTTGQDVFFRQGEYNPGSSGGRELLAHELTHVVQQNGDGIQRKMTVSQPGDPHELEADRMAKAVIQQEQQLAPDADRQVLSRPEEEEKETATKLDRAAIQRQPEAVKNEDEEKKKKLQMKSDQSMLSRQAEEEEPK
jgi:Domain of unknown function (DUF4157)